MSTTPALYASASSHHASNRVSKSFEEGTPSSTFGGRACRPSNSNTSLNSALPSVPSPSSTDSNARFTSCCRCQSRPIASACALFATARRFSLSTSFSSALISPTVFVRSLELSFGGGGGGFPGHGFPGHGFPGDGFGANFRQPRQHRRYVRVQRGGRVYNVPLDEYEHFHSGFQYGAYGRDEGWLDAGLVIQFIIFGLMAVFFYLSANIAAVAGEAGRSERSAGASADEYADAYDGDDDGAADNDDDDGAAAAADYILLGPDAPVRDLKYECARRGLSIAGCAEKADLLHLLGIPVAER
mmetsp:Transcript_15781/g.48853  ORF Transcript_15781/g.48853 Transcript_15781/m.48853 type:complete len:300 (-) Transcript_15781:25-924(-)